MASLGQDEGVERALAGDTVALARLISRVEQRDADLAPLMSEVNRRSKGAPCIGITGPPGAGKSTIVDQLIAGYRGRGLSVGVLAVDPSSPFSGGAVLGDRIRMVRHALDEGVFIRSLGSRGRHGGLSRATRDVRAVLDAAGRQVILLETVGVGQTELEVMEVADTTVVILVPEAGDAVQTLKAGLLEIADLFVVNKADREGADRMVADLTNLVALRGGEGSATGEAWEPPVLATVATTGKGVPELLEALERHREWLAREGGARRREARALSAVREILVERMERSIDQLAGSDPEVQAVLHEVATGKVDPHTAAERLLKRL